MRTSAIAGRLSPGPGEHADPGNDIPASRVDEVLGLRPWRESSAAPWVTRTVVAADRWLIRGLLGPGRLTQRLADLEHTRALAVDAAAARLRRLERDLHDGAQIRPARPADHRRRPRRGRPAQGSGLSGLAQRVAMVDGRLDIASPPGGPTRITVELPLRA